MRNATLTTTRRSVLITISQLATAATLASCSRPAEQATGSATESSLPAATASNSDLELLASVAYDILPYPELPPQLYLKAAQQILKLNDTNVVAGLAKLRAASQQAPWKNVPETQRIAILASLQDTPFFSVLRTNTLQVLLRDPATFAIVGYGGSSIQYGGYINHGFNDIDWLPAARTK
jgi:hypothetical protein